MSEVKQMEFLFLWDARMTNPNGDMLNDNAPRFDEADSRAIVSDVRVKRTIRDDMQNRKGMEIFVNNAETVQSAETRFKEVQGLEALAKKRDEIKAKLGEMMEKKAKEELAAFLSCIDTRLFGGVAPKSGIQIIGPVQFCWAKTLNQTETVMSQGTGAFGKDGSGNKTFRTDNYIPYGLFAMYGVVNRANASKSQVSPEDIEAMFDSMWNGTKLLNTRSKMGQKPRMLIQIIHKESGMIGGLDELVKLNNAHSDELRSFDLCELDFSALIKSIGKMQNIEKTVIGYDESAEKWLSAFAPLPVETVVL